MAKHRIQYGAHKRQLKANPPSRRLYQFSLICIAIILIINSLVGEKGLIDSIAAGHRYEKLSLELARLRQENKILRNKAQRLLENSSAIEEIARKDLGLIRPGELLFIFPPSNIR